MNPFDLYPHEGRRLLGPARGSNCRHGYGLRFMQITRQTDCAYCGLNFLANYRNWLNMALDHVVPTSLCLEFEVKPEWIDDCSNRVLACAACNGFENRYKPSFRISKPSSLPRFYDLRDRIFRERYDKIQLRRDKEHEFFMSKPWKQAS